MPLLPEGAQAGMVGRAVDAHHPLDIRLGLEQMEKALERKQMRHQKVFPQSG